MAKSNDYYTEYEKGYDLGYAKGTKNWRDTVLKKDFELIADILRGQKIEKKDSVVGYKQWLKTVIAFEDALSRTHPMFQRSTFLEACNALSPDTAKFLKITEKE